MSKGTCATADATSDHPEASFAGWKRAEVVLGLGISVKRDNHLHAAFRSLRHRLTQDADVFTEVRR